jgi:sugar phosphate isomerase/epimerase
MTHTRRKFIKISGGLSAGLALSSVSGLSLFSSCGNSAGNYGIQLYTLRDDMPKDPKGVLKQLAGFGYKQIEGYEGPQGMFWGMSNTDFKKYMDDLGMSFIASHCDITKDFEKKAADAAAIGMKYLICPWLGPQTTLDAFKKFADDFNQKGEICKKNGIRFAYHNHDYSFKEMEGQMPQDVMMKGTDASLVDYEMDIYWVVTANQDPVTWLKKYPNRWRLCHVKDRAKNATTTDASVVIGQGMIDFPTILKEAKAQGMQYYIVEQEKYEGTTPLKAAEADAAYMKNLDL